MKSSKFANIFGLYFDQNNYKKAYATNDEYIDDIKSLMDIYVEIAFDLRKNNQLKIKNKAAIHAFSFKGIVITDEEVDSIIESAHVDFQSQLDPAVPQNLQMAWDHIESRASATTSISLPMHDFFLKFNLSRFKRLCVITALSIEIDLKYDRLFCYIQDNNTAKLPTYGLAYALTLLTGPVSNTEIYQILNDRILSSIFVGVVRDANCSVLTIEMSLRRRAVNIFLGDTDDELFLQRFCHSYFPTDPLEELIIGQEFNQELTQIISKLLESGIENRMIHIFGEEGAGKRFHIRHLACNLDRPVVIADFAYFKSIEQDKAIYFSETLALEGTLNQKIICLHNVELTETELPLFSAVMEELLCCDNLVFVLSKNSKLPSSNISRYASFLDIEVKPLSATESLTIWSYLASKHNVQDEIDFKGIVNKFNYTPGQIKQILLKASISSNTKGNQIKNSALVEVCKSFSIHNLGKKASLINCKYTFDDLVIDETQKNILIQACNYIKFKDVVYEAWDFGSKVAYGRGLSIIFYGPPGTGKTMGAQVIANELDLQLYKVDVSQIMNKYVGETEKNLNSIFSEAKTSNAILLFDEADSLFGKRTDVKNSNDKFSNSGISFLLQKMEEYNGVSILTTNKFNHFDDAFRRRIKFMVNFPAPSIEMRKLLWQKIFPQNAPLCQDFDAGLLAEKFELSGSSIKSIAIMAAYSAASSQTKITMDYIVAATKYEYQKLGKVSSDLDFNIY